MANGYMKKCSAPLIIGETGIEITVRRRLTPVPMAVINKTRNNRRRRECGEKETLAHHWWERKPVQPRWKSVEVPQKMLNRTTL